MSRDYDYEPLHWGTPAINELASVHMMFLRVDSLAPWEKTVALNALAPVFKFTPARFERCYRAWAADKQLYIQRMEGLSRSLDGGES